MGIDLGGTKILAIVLGEKGRILARVKTKTRGEEGYRAVLDRVAGVYRETLAEAGLRRVASVGVAVPGSVDDAGRIIKAPNMGWKMAPFGRDLSRRIGVPVSTENDGNLGTLAEARVGAGRGAKTVVGLFVGTGLGGGIVLDGRVWRGARGAAGEVGHVIIRRGAARCGCGARGCVEAYASKYGVARRLRRDKGLKGWDGTPSDLGSGKLAEAYREGNRAVRRALERCASDLGILVTSIRHLLDPEVFVIGGGLFEEMGKRLLPFVRRAAVQAEHLIPPRAPEIRLARLGGDAVAMGAAILPGEARP